MLDTGERSDPVDHNWDTWIVDLRQKIILKTFLRSNKDE